MSELIVIFITIGIGMDWIYFYFSFGLLWRQTIHFFLGVNLFGTEQPYIFCAARSWILLTCRFKYADLFTICFDQYAAYAHSWRLAVRNSAITVTVPTVVKSNLQWNPTRGGEGNTWTGWNILDSLNHKVYACGSKTLIPLVPQNSWLMDVYSRKTW